MNETNATPARPVEPKQYGSRHLTWMDYARRADGAVLWAQVQYNHSTRGTWTFVVVDATGAETRLDRRPRFGKVWELTAYGADVEDERKWGTV